MSPVETVPDVVPDPSIVAALDFQLDTERCRLKQEAHELRHVVRVQEERITQLLRIIERLADGGRYRG